MESIIQISGITGATPYLIYACDFYDDYCQLITGTSVTVPPTITLQLPVEFNNKPLVKIKIIDGDGCETSKVEVCS